MKTEEMMRIAAAVMFPDDTRRARRFGHGRTACKLPLRMTLDARDSPELQREKAIGAMRLGCEVYGANGERIMHVPSSPKGGLAAARKREAPFGASAG